jgi:hypothetical protein
MRRASLGPTESATHIGEHDESDAGAGIQASPKKINFEAQFEKLMETFFLEKAETVKSIRTKYAPQLAEMES